MGEHAPVDLAGRTPLAWSARKKRRDLEEELFALGDPSIFPSVPLHRCSRLVRGADMSGRALRPCGVCVDACACCSRAGSRAGGEELSYGYCSTPGWNDKMEDTVSVTTPLDDEDDQTGLFAVFDGHAGEFRRSQPSRSLSTPCDPLTTTAASVATLSIQARQPPSSAPITCGRCCQRVPRGRPASGRGTRCAAPSSTPACCSTTSSGTCPSSEYV